MNFTHYDQKTPAFFLLVSLCVTVTMHAQPIRNIGPATTPEAVGFSSARLTRIYTKVFATPYGQIGKKFKNLTYQSIID